MHTHKHTRAGTRAYENTKSISFIQKQKYTHAAANNSRRTKEDQQMKRKVKNKKQSTMINC